MCVFIRCVIGTSSRLIPTDREVICEGLFSPVTGTSPSATTQSAEHHVTLPVIPKEGDGSINDTFYLKLFPYSDDTTKKSRLPSWT